MSCRSGRAVRAYPSGRHRSTFSKTMVFWETERCAFCRSTIADVSVVAHPQAMIALLLVIAAQSAPPAPSPPEPAWIEAAAIFHDNPISEETKRFAIDHAVSMATEEAARKSPSKYDPRKFDDLRHRIASYLPIDHTKLDEEVGRCATEAIAFKLDLDDIRQARRFMQTPAGSRLWQVVSYADVVGCYRSSLFLGAKDEDYHAVGLKPPRRHKPKLDKGNSIS